MSLPDVALDFLKSMGHDVDAVHVSANADTIDATDTSSSTAGEERKRKRESIRIPSGPLEEGFKFVRFCGWCCEGTNDKIWAVLTKTKESDDSMTIWGPIYGTLQYKLSGKRKPIKTLVQEKKKKGYKGNNHRKAYELIRAFADEGYVLTHDHT